MMKIIIIALFSCLVIIEAGPECTFDKNCTVNGVVNIWVNGKCVLKNEDKNKDKDDKSAECTKDVDYLKIGIYYKCKKSKCERSDHKICLTDDDCKKNFFHRKCKNNHCH
jgi:hypothetical protein